MTPDPNRPEVLLSVPNEIEAAAITTALAEYGVEAFAAGGYTSGFRAEAPGNVKVLVKHADLDRAKQALAGIRQQQDEIDWSKVDVMDGAEEESPTDETAEAEPLWRARTGRLWMAVTMVAVLIGLVVWLFAGFSVRLANTLVLSLLPIVLVTLWYCIVIWLFRWLKS
jgi:hypothetical protein